MTIILGIDPGTNFTGWGVINKEGQRLTYIDSGCIKPPKGKLEDKLLFIYNYLNEVIERYTPQIAVIEQIFVNTNYSSSLILAHTRGALLLSLRLRNLPTVQYSANFIKKAVTGQGHATKEGVRRMVILLLPTALIKTSDASDALATAICYANYSHLSENITV